MFDLIKQIISKQLGVEEDDIAMETKIMDDLGADSLDIVEMMMAIEEECGIAIPDDVVTTLETVSDVVNYLENAQ
ncbi:MAG: acyl carrier protein [Clostridiales bacterium]|nr:acyl carrier protein [Clostridiales bacterium]